jgi:nucleoside-diphosphate-sugar epimerase
MSRSLVFGLSGQVGSALLPMLQDIGPVLALSRWPPPPAPGVEWRHDTLEAFGNAPEDCATILSLGPLDAFAGWLQRTRPTAARIVALGSMGLRDKAGSPDAGERALAARLAEAEQYVFARGRDTGAAVTVLRPSLLYGSGRDRSLTPLAARARRWRRLPWPRSATGLRQPVHVDDVASAVRACLDAPASHGRAFDLPGAERLRFDAMVARHLARHAPRARLLRVPDAFFQASALAARMAGKGEDLRGWLWRARQDQVGDPAEAEQAFAFRPRMFAP